MNWVARSSRSVQGLFKDGGGDVSDGFHNQHGEVYVLDLQCDARVHVQQLLRRQLDVANEAKADGSYVGHDRVANLLHRGEHIGGNGALVRCAGASKESAQVEGGAAATPNLPNIEEELGLDDIKGEAKGIHSEPRCSTTTNSRQC